MGELDKLFADLDLAGAELDRLFREVKGDSGSEEVQKLDQSAQKSQKSSQNKGNSGTPSRISFAPGVSMEGTSDTRSSAAGGSIFGALNKGISESGEAIFGALNKGLSESGEAISGAINKGLSESGEAISGAINKGLSESGEAILGALDKGISALGGSMFGKQAAGSSAAKEGAQLGSGSRDQWDASKLYLEEEAEPPTEEDVQCYQIRERFLGVHHNEELDQLQRVQTSSSGGYWDEQTGIGLSPAQFYMKIGRGLTETPISDETRRDMALLRGTNREADTGMKGFYPAYILLQDEPSRPRIEDVLDNTEIPAEESRVHDGFLEVLDAIDDVVAEKDQAQRRKERDYRERQADLDKKRYYAKLDRDRAREKADRWRRV